MPALSSQEITRRSRSNLAFALACLPAKRKHGMISFYAFCRVVDDIADDPGKPVAEKAATLDQWRAAILAGDGSTDPLLAEVLALSNEYGFAPALLTEIIDGVRSDLSRTRYATMEELLAYCYKVASAVGLVSIRIFGCKNAGSEAYAVNLGYALQLTNILRDVGQDARETGRIYLPLEDLRRFNVTEQEILDGVCSDRLLSLLDDVARRADHYYELAESQLPAEDARALIAARMMAQIYREILVKLRRECFPVFERRVRLHPVRKAWILGSHLARGLFGGA
jgi:15-cis-phytoene synthase